MYSIEVLRDLIGDETFRNLPSALITSLSETRIPLDEDQKTVEAPLYTEPKAATALECGIDARKLVQQRCCRSLSCPRNALDPACYKDAVAQVQWKLGFLGEISLAGTYGAIYLLREGA